MNTTAAFAVHDPSQVAESRRAASFLAHRLGFSDTDEGRAALVVTELATNLVKHARRGELLLQAIHAGTGEPPAGLEVLAIDAGPGMSDPALSRLDGHSTAGTLGHGLGAIERQSDYFQLYTAASGTIAMARIWRDGTPPGGKHQPLYEVGAIHVSKPGEYVCGDAFDWRIRDERLAILVADGLGHGQAAYDAASAAVRIFEKAYEHPPERLIGDIHAALRPTRGAAVAGLVIDLERGTCRYAGLGNISGVVLLPSGGRHSMVSHNGTAGHTASRVQEFNYAVPRGSVVVMHSDGLASQWDLAAFPGLRTRHPSIVAAALYRDFSRRRDDVTVVVAKGREAL